MKKTYMHFKKIVAISLMAFSSLVALSASAASISDSVKGRILLQVEKKGEAWYVDPATGKRTFLYRPAQAFQIMRERGTGISTGDLERIPPSYLGYVGTDTDGDGLPDSYEKALGTDPSKKDTDGDGYDDYSEIRNLYNAKGAGRILPDQFTINNRGKIFLQVQSHGEAWWVHPSDDKRYFLGTPADALNLMRKSGLGISNADLAKIAIDDRPIECGDYGCFSAATELGQPAKGIVSGALELFGVITATKNEVRFIAENNGTSFVYSSKIKEYTATLSEAFKANARAEGTSEEEIAAQQKTANESVQGLIGSETRCTFTDKKKMSEVFAGWGNGNASSEDLNFADCVSIDADGKTTPLSN